MTKPDRDTKSLLKEMSANMHRMVEVQQTTTESLRILNRTVDGLMKRVANMEVELIQREQRGGKKRGKL